MKKVKKRETRTKNITNRRQINWQTLALNVLMFTWNMKGLNIPIKRKGLSECKLNIVVCFLQEAHFKQINFN